MFSVDCWGELKTSTKSLVGSQKVNQPKKFHDTWNFFLLVYKYINNLLKIGHIGNIGHIGLHCSDGPLDSADFPSNFQINQTYTNEKI